MKPWMIVAISMAFIAIGLSVSAAIVDGPFPGDIGLARWIQETIAGKSLERTAELVYSAKALAFAVAVWLAFRTRRYALALSGVVIILALFANPLFKEIVDRARPGPTQLVVREHANGEGFPSGHADTSALTFGYAAVVLASVAGGWLRWSFLPLCAGAIVLVGWERVYDGAHWPSDVAGGVAIGTLLLVVALHLPTVVDRGYHRLHPT